MLEDVVRKFVVNEPGTGGHGGLGGEQWLILLILHADGFQSPPGRDLVLGHHGGDVVSVIADSVGKEPPV